MSAAQTRQQELIELVKKQVHLEGSEHTSANNIGVLNLIKTWLSSLDADDLLAADATSLASILLPAFVIGRDWTPTLGCQISPLTYQDSRGIKASALVILNPDMPFLVDGIVMALRQQQIASRSILNAVLSVQRDNSGKAVLVTPAKPQDHPTALVSVVVCLLTEQLSDAEQRSLTAGIAMSVNDAAVVHADAKALSDKCDEIAALAENTLSDGAETAAFLRWANIQGFEIFGYLNYVVVEGQTELQRNLPSALGVLRDKKHPVYGECLRGIPGDYATLFNRKLSLSVVKADVQSTLYRDQQLEFIGVRETNAAGQLLGEHCFVGLFSHAASVTALADLPFARARISEVLQIAGVRPDGFKAEKFLEVLESLPWVEVFEAEPAWLAQICSAAVALYKQPRTKIFARRDVYGRHLNVIIYMPRELYSAKIVDALASTLESCVGADEVQVETLLADGPLARLYLIAKDARPNLDLDTDIAKPLLDVLEGWHSTFDDLVDAVSDAHLRVKLRQYYGQLSTDYINDTAPQTAFDDLLGLCNSSNDTKQIGVKIALQAPVNIRLQSVQKVPTLSHILPALHNAGIVIEREQSHQIATNAQGQAIFITSLELDAASAEKMQVAGVAEVAQELFTQLLNNQAEDGRMNALVIEAALRPMEVQVIRAYVSYWRQAGCRFSIRYMADCLKKQAPFARQLIEAFLTRFNPALSDSERAAGTQALIAFKEHITDINHADSEDILRTIAELMLATVRTSYFQDKQQNGTVLFKFDTTQLSWLPQPRPFREIFVFNRRFEGVHLRGGPVARGGLRWSDRMEDYRTEVLGLVKAQMVKNAVIVPAGAKGGFVCKMVPKDANGVSTREMIAAEGEAVYRLFIAGLLDLTDNRSKGAIIHPAQTVCLDGEDPYLVVAADKGTATFSDIANGIAVQRGFWLGDAFASGGSNGYDHNKLGITAKGAWEAVKRHFYEMGHDLNTTPITMVGVGDMSGDVFGNGLLLSRQVKLIAAFDHRHIFIDPTPNVDTSFAERQRMFALPRSSWDDYDKSLISTGGGVYPRTARSITLSQQAQQALHTDEQTVTPEQLLHIILMSQVDLFYNGGIGTYIKATTETHAQVKDRANDNIRVNGAEMRCKVVAEGGNLGATQAGRIEFAAKGGRIFTDAIDNSAGVDCSDHEVNVKIWLDTEVNAGKINEAERNHVLNQITDEIEHLVLRDNAQQTRLLVREHQAQNDPATLDGYAALIASLEGEGVLSRTLEQLPSGAELEQRKQKGQGLTTPELAVVIANVKNRYKGILSALPLTTKPWAKSLLTPYFPIQLVATRNSLDHPLANPILGTVLANEAVNRCGALMLVELAHKYKVSEAEVILAWAQTWSTLHLAPIFDEMDKHALTEPQAVNRAQDAKNRELQKALIEGVLTLSTSHHASNDDKDDKEGHKLDKLSQLFADKTASAALLNIDKNAQPFAAAQQTVDALLSMADFLFAACVAPRPANLSLASFIQIGLQLRAKSGIAGLEASLLSNHDAAQAALKNHALNALRRAQQRLLQNVLEQVSTPDNPALVDAAISSVLDKAGIKSDIQAGAINTANATLEAVLLQVWTLAEAV